MNLYDTVTILTPTTAEDRYHNEVEAWPESGPNSPAWVGPQRTTESLADGDQTQTSLACVLPPSVTITAQDRIRWRGDDYAIDGEPLPVVRRGVLHHYELTMKEVKG